MKLILLASFKQSWQQQQERRKTTTTSWKFVSQLHEHISISSPFCWNVSTCSEIHCRCVTRQFKPPRNANRRWAIGTHDTVDARIWMWRLPYSDFSNYSTIGNTWGLSFQTLAWLMTVEKRTTAMFSHLLLDTADLDVYLRTVGVSICDMQKVGLAT